MTISDTNDMSTARLDQNHCHEILLLTWPSNDVPKRSQFQNHWRCSYRQRTEWPDRCVIWMCSKQIPSYVCLCMQRTPDIASICLRSCRPLLCPTCTCMSSRYLQDYYWWNHGLDQRPLSHVYYPMVQWPSRSKQDGNRPVTLQPVKMAELSLSSPQIGSVMKGKNGL